MHAMNYFQIIEFSKIYKRILELETTIKARTESSLFITYSQKGFYRLIPFIKTLSKKKYGTKLDSIINSKLSENKKLEKFLKIVYLSDLLQMITNFKPLYKDKKFINNLYFLKPDKNIARKYKDILYNLRNNIMHFNLNDYIKNKKEYLEALSYWERLFFCSNAKLQELPPVKPSIMPILKMLEKEYPEIMQMDDRVICDVVDDILFINGIPFEKYPKYWSIVRQIYEFKKNNKNENLNEPITQLSLLRHCNKSFEKEVFADIIKKYKV